MYGAWLFLGTGSHCGWCCSHWSRTHLSMWEGILEHCRRIAAVMVADCVKEDTAIPPTHHDPVQRHG